MTKGLRTVISRYVLTFFRPWIRVYEFLTWGGPFEESDAGRAFYGWELTVRYWPFFLALLLVFLLTWKLRSQGLLFLLVGLGLLTSLWMLTFGDFFPSDATGLLPALSLPCFSGYFTGLLFAIHFRQSSVIQDLPAY